VTNPKLIVEVLSPGTEDCDCNERLKHYKRIPSLSGVALVEHHAELVEVWTRTSNSWSQVPFVAAELVRRDVIGCTLSVDAVYGCCAWRLTAPWDSAPRRRNVAVSPQRRVSAPADPLRIRGDPIRGRSMRILN